MNYENTENIQMVSWKNYFNSDNTISEYAFPTNFGTRIAKDVMYLKNKESLNLKQFRKTNSKKTLKITAPKIASFLSTLGFLYSILFWCRENCRRGKLPPRLEFGFDLGLALKLGLGSNFPLRQLS